MLMKEVNLTVAPVSDFSAGVAVGLGLGLGLVALGICC